MLKIPHPLQQHNPQPVKVYLINRDVWDLKINYEMTLFLHQILWPISSGFNMPSFNVSLSVFMIIVMFDLYLIFELDYHPLNLDNYYI